MWGLHRRINMHDFVSHKKKIDVLRTEIEIAKDDQSPVIERFTLAEIDKEVVVWEEM